MHHDTTAVELTSGGLTLRGDLRFPAGASADAGVPALVIVAAFYSARLPAV